MTPTFRALVLGFFPAMMIAIAIAYANFIPIVEKKLPPDARIPSKNKESYGWPFIDRWSEWEVVNLHEFYSDPTSMNASPAWQKIEDDDGQAFAYNRVIGVSITLLMWIVAAVGVSRLQRKRAGQNNDAPA